jgi:ribosomal protein S3
VGSKANPIRLRLGSFQLEKNCWYQENHLNLKHFWESEDSNWEKGLNESSNFSRKNNLKLYLEKQQSLKRYWSSAWSGRPAEKKYQDSLHLDFIIRRLVESAFLKINFIAYNTRVRIRKRKTQLKIQVFVFPSRVPKKRSKLSLDNTQIKLIELIQNFSGLKTSLRVIDIFSLLSRQKEKIKARSDRAEAFDLVRLNPREDSQKWSFQLINTLFMVKSASLLAKFIALELPKVKKRHVFWLSFLEKSMNSFWKLNLQSDNYLRGFSFFKQKLVGIRVQIKGRLNGQDRKQKTSFSVGRLSLQELDVSIDYASEEALTRYGVFGVKVWVALASEKDHKSFSAKKRKVSNINKRRNSNSLFNEPIGW